MYSVFYLFMLIFGLLAIPLLQGLGYGWCFDFLTRTNANDAFISCYYFWWTSLTYVPFFFFSLFLIFFGWLHSHSSSLLPWLMSVFFVGYLTEFADYHTLNVAWVQENSALQGLNVLLTNALNRYHPFIFYSSSILLFVFSSYYFTSISTGNAFSGAVFTRLSVILLWTAASVNIIALWLGSWWALQEGTWGGWWNWDSSETFGLLVLITILALSHAAYSKRTTYRLCIKVLASIGGLVLSYFFIQLNFDLVSHNFGSKFFFFFNNNLFFLEVSCFIIILMFGWLVWIGSLRRNNISYSPVQRFTRMGFFSLPKYVPALVVIIWIIWSYKPLLNYFFWNFFSINVLNLEWSIQLVNYVAFFSLITWLGSFYRSLGLSLVLLSASWTIWISPLLLLSWGRPVTLVFHTTLLLISSLNLVLSDFGVITWAIECVDAYLAEGEGILAPVPTLHVLDTSAIDVVATLCSPSSQGSISWNVYSSANSPAVNFFNLDLNSSSFFNHYHLSKTYTVVYLVLELPLIPSLNLAFVISLLLLLRSTVFSKRGLDSIL